MAEYTQRKAVGRRVINRYRPQRIAEGAPLVSREFLGFPCAPFLNRNVGGGTFAAKASSDPVAPGLSHGKHLQSFA
ncbi:hypothetical protein [Streptomyces tendae]|uniref:hypothetical protein n=1 Tax=Streptomyces tendae TaxID=1932 RepID=UPI001675F405|nr:hypothetical protein [Streptomyces tendae]